MNEQEPIEIRPLTLRGVFGVAWRLLRRDFWGITGLALVYVLVTLALMLLCALPGLLGIVDIAGEAGNVMRPSEVARTVGGVLISFLLLFLMGLALWLVAGPMFSGTLYNELSARLYGETAGFGRLLRRTGYSLKRFFTLNLCLSVCVWAVGMAAGVVSSLISPIFALSALAGGVHTGVGGSLDAMVGLLPGFAVAGGLMGLLTTAVSICGTAFLSFTYPVAVNEGLNNFNAIKRGFQLVYKRFGRVLGSMALLWGANLLAGAVLLGIMALIITWAGIAHDLPAMLVTLALFFVAELLLGAFMLVYQAALNTTLYHDARVRLEPPRQDSPAAPEPDDATT